MKYFEKIMQVRYMQYLMDPSSNIIGFFNSPKNKIKIKIKQGMSKWIGKEWLVLLQLL